VSQDANNQGRFIVIKTKLTIKGKEECKKRGDLSQRQLKQVPKLIILTNSKSFENLKLKRKEKKRRREHIIYNKYNVCMC
jgi:hypothetical protein